MKSEIRNVLVHEDGRVTAEQYVVDGVTLGDSMIGEITFPDRAAFERMRAHVETLGWHVDEPRDFEPFPTITVYRTTVKGGLDCPIAEIEADDPVAALETWAGRCGFEDFSIDTDGLRVVVCPARSTFRYYAYREPVKAGC